MPKKEKICSEKKEEIVQRYLHAEVSLKEATENVGVNQETVR